MSLWLLLKQQSEEILLGVNEHIYLERKGLKEKKIFAKPKILTLQCHEHLGVMYSAESNFSNFVIEYLGEIETEF